MEKTTARPIILFVQFLNATHLQQHFPCQAPSTRQNTDKISKKLIDTRHISVYTGANYTCNTLRLKTLRH